MSSEPIATTAATSPDAADSAEKGMLIAMLLLVVSGVTGMLYLF